MTVSILGLAIFVALVAGILIGAHRAARGIDPHPQETMLDRFGLFLERWLSPEGRKRIYGALAALGGILTLVGVVRQETVTSWLGITQAALGVAGLLLASWHAQRVDTIALYSLLAALVAALKAAGVVEDGTASHWLDVLAALAAAAGPFIAWTRTDPSTPTGEPATEYLARHAA